MTKIAFIFPGQGAQYPGMGKDFFDSRLAAKEVFQQADELLKENFSKKIFEGTSEELSQTNVSQLAIYIMSTALHRAMLAEVGPITPHVIGGLSLGEYTALTASSRLSFEEGIKLVEARGRFMHEASQQNPGTLAVVLGLDRDQVQRILTPFQDQGTEVWIANLNCPGQVVIAGQKAAIQVIDPVLKDRGAKRVMFLEVSGAFHTPYMKSAQHKLAPMIEGAAMVDSEVLFTSNVTGGLVSDLGEIKKNLIAQVASPTLWESDIKAMDSAGAELFIEIGCGKTLAGMNRKIKPSGTTVSVEKLEDLAQLEDNELLKG